MGHTGATGSMCMKNYTHGVLEVETYCSCKLVSFHRLLDKSFSRLRQTQPWASKIFSGYVSYQAVKKSALLQHQS